MATSEQGRAAFDKNACKIALRNIRQLLVAKKFDFDFELCKDFEEIVFCYSSKIYKSTV